MPSTTSGPRPESTSIAIAGSGSESTLVASGEVADPSRTGRLINFPPPVARIADTSANCFFSVSVSSATFPGSRSARYIVGSISHVVTDVSSTPVSHRLSCASGASVCLTSERRRILRK